MILSFVFVSFFGGNGIGMQDLVIARQVLYHLSCAPNPFHFKLFIYSFLLIGSCVFCWGLASDCSPPTYMLLV
jgi:hypothetical protein